MKNIWSFDRANIRSEETICAFGCCLLILSTYQLCDSFLRTHSVQNDNKDDDYNDDDNDDDDDDDENMDFAMRIVHIKR